MIKMVKVNKLVEDVKSIRPDVDTKHIIHTAKVFPEEVLDKLDLDDDISEWLYNSVYNYYKSGRDKENIFERTEEEIDKACMEIFGCLPPKLDLDDIDD